MAFQRDLSQRTFEKAIQDLYAHKWSTNANTVTLEKEVDERFDPRNVDWAALEDLYGDDPVLQALFKKLGAYDFSGYWTTVDSDWSSTGGTYKFQWSPSTGTVTSTNTPIDVTSFGNTNKTYLSGMGTVSGTFSGKLDDSLRVSKPPTVKYKRKNAAKS